MYSGKSDVWSFGCLIMEIFDRQIPYPTLSTVDVAVQVSEGTIEQPVPVAAPDFVGVIMKKCFQYEADDRPSAAEVVEMFAEAEIKFGGFWGWCFWIEI